MDIYGQKKVKIWQKIAQNNKYNIYKLRMTRRPDFVIFGYFMEFLPNFAHTWPNMGKIEKLWQILNFCQFCTHFDAFIGKINFLPFFANLAGKQTNSAQNQTVIWNSDLQIRIDVFLWVYGVYVLKIRYFFHFFNFLHFWMLQIENIA